MSRRHNFLVPFALSAIAFLSLFLGAFEVARYAYVSNAVAEATRVGARMVAVCSLDIDNKVRAAMNALVPQIPAADASKVVITRVKADKSTACTATTDCAYVTVTVTGVSVPTVTPLVALNLVLPTVASTMPREYMNSTSNPYCN